MIDQLTTIYPDLAKYMPYSFRSETWLQPHSSEPLKIFNWFLIYSLTLPDLHWQEPHALGTAFLLISLKKGKKLQIIIKISFLILVRDKISVRFLIKLQIIINNLLLCDFGSCKIVFNMLIGLVVWRPVWTSLFYCYIVFEPPRNLY